MELHETVREEALERVAEDQAKRRIDRTGANEKSCVLIDAGAPGLNQLVSWMWLAVTYIRPSGPSAKVSGQRRRGSVSTGSVRLPARREMPLVVGEAI